MGTEQDDSTLKKQANAAAARAGSAADRRQQTTTDDPFLSDMKDRANETTLDGNAQVNSPQADSPDDPVAGRLSEDDR